jgi:hypothetical protein
MWGQGQERCEGGRKMDELEQVLAEIIPFKDGFLGPIPMA